MLSRSIEFGTIIPLDLGHDRLSDTVTLQLFPYSLQLAENVPVFGQDATKVNRLDAVVQVGPEELQTDGFSLLRRHKIDSCSFSFPISKSIEWA